jgi:hypothetical protein
MAEVDGIHIRDLPVSSSGLPCMPSGAALPPNVLFKLHHDELLNMDAMLNEHSNKIQMLSNRIDKGAGSMSNTNMSMENSGNGGNGGSERNDLSYDSLVNNTEFITKLLDNILTNTNLSEIINQIEPLQKENESLRALLNSQQTTLNELSGLVMKLLANGLPSYSNNENREYDSYENTITDGVSSVYIPNTEQYMGQNTNGPVYDANIVDGVCSLSVTNLEELHDEEEEDGGDEDNVEGQEVDS